MKLALLDWAVIAIIRRPQICSFVEGNLSCNMHKSKV